MWRAKQPWIAAAAACFLVAAGLVGVKYYTDKAAYETNLAAGQAEVRNVINEANTQAAEWETIQQNNDPRQFIENLRRVLDHRNVMSRLLEDITLATLALNPQEGLMSTDYDAIKAIPRNERNRIYIDEITFEYEPLPVEAAAASTTPGTVTADPSAGALDTLVDGTYNLERFFPEGQDVGPRFLVTISGTTPVGEPDTFLNQYFIKWLKENADRPDRPYVFTFGEQNPIRKLTEVTEETPTGTAATPTPATPGGGGFGSTFGNRGGGFGSGRTYNQPSASAGSAVAGAAEFANIETLLPERPNAQESRGSDWQFELQWIVQLRSPQEARPRVNSPTPDGDTAPAPNDQPAADPATPSANNPAGPDAAPATPSPGLDR